MRKFLLILAFIVIAFVAYAVSSYNKLNTLKLDVENAWAKVESKYQRRSDLIPNLVSTVKAYAAHEKSTLENVTNARAKAGGVVKLSNELLNNPDAFKKFEQAQAGISGALQRLMVSVERYPELKADKNFLRLQDELSGTENRISVERDRFNDAVTVYNRSIVVFPKNIIANIFGLTKLSVFRSEQGSEKAPKLNF